MSTTLLYDAVSKPASQFTEALAQNAASAMYNLPFGPPVGTRRFLIRALQVLTNENYGPQLNFFATAAGRTADPATNTFLAPFGFVSSMGYQLGGAGVWYYYIDGMAIPYFDGDTIGTQTPPSLHVVLQNISPTAKSAYPTDSTKVTAWLEPVQTY